MGDMYGKHISAALTGTLPQSAPWDQYSSENDPEERKTQFTNSNTCTIKMGSPRLSQL